MPLSETDELNIRNEIVALLLTEPLAGNVFDRRRSISSRADFYRKLNVDVNDGREVRFIEVELLNLDDSPDEGADDNPVALLTYNFHLFHQFVDERSDDSNSDRDFTNLLIRLRRLFLNSRDFIGRRGVSDDAALTADEFTQFGPDTFTDVNGHFKDLTITIRVYDDPQ